MNECCKCKNEPAMVMNHIGVYEKAYLLRSIGRVLYDNDEFEVDDDICVKTKMKNMIFFLIIIEDEDKDDYDYLFLLILNFFWVF